MWAGDPPRAEPVSFLQSSSPTALQDFAGKCLGFPGRAGQAELPTLPAAAAGTFQSEWAGGMQAAPRRLSNVSRRCISFVVNKDASSGLVCAQFLPGWQKAHTVKQL